MTRRAMAPMVRGYVALVSLVAVVAAVAATAFVPGPTHPTWWALGPLTVVLVAAEYLQVRYRYRGQVEAFTGFDTAMAPLLVGFGGGPVVAVVAFAQLAVGIVRRNQPVKVLFNVAQWSAAAAGGSLALHAVSGGGGVPVLGVLVALLAVNAVNAGAFALLLRIAGEGRRKASAARRTVVGARLIGLVVALALGVLLAAAYRAEPVSVIGFLPPFVIVYAGSLGLATARADHARVVALHRATHELAVAPDPGTAVAGFLREVRECFTVDAVGLVVEGGDLTGVHRFDADGYSLLPHVMYPVAQPGRLVVPLRSGGLSRGVLSLDDPRGIEAGNGGRVVAEALAAELVGYLERHELLVRLGEERARLSQVVDATSDGIISLNREGILDSWNAGMEAITGYRAAEVVGGRGLSQLEPRGHDDTTVDLAAWALGVSFPSELQVTAADGRNRWLSCSYGTGATKERLVVVARDITRSRELDRLKDDFVAVVSHELRTPLAPIKGWAATLLARSDRMSEEQRTQGLRAIQQHANRLEQLVLNILEASRVESIRPDAAAELVNAGEVVAQVVDELTACAPGRRIELDGMAQVHLVRGQRVWVERALSNLVSNALKYSPDTSIVEVSVSVSGRDVVIDVRDHGPGIPVAARSRVFERFERLDDAGTQPGTGLGLYITRQLALAMGGSVDLTDAPGGGSVFSLRLPHVGVPQPRVVDVANACAAR